MRAPLAYYVDHQVGSHRKLKSPNGYPTLGFSFHDNVTIPPRLVKKILVRDVGLSEEEALGLI
jgi:predicted RNA binding protein YcfA (HicA-like mRNA interferase family)